MRTLYDAAGGADGLLALAAAWHERVMADEVVSHAFQFGVQPDHVERLAAFSGEALGGPAGYSSGFGDESIVARMHSGNGEHPEMDERAIRCFDEALVDVGIGGSLHTALHAYFAWVTTVQLDQWPSSAEDVPDGLAVPRWSLEGLQD